MKFEGKVVLVTGAGGNIGSITAKAFAKEGAKVAVVDCNEETVNVTCADIVATGGVAKAFIADIRDDQQVNACVEAIEKELGGVDILVNLAGGSARKNRAHFYEQKTEVFKNVIEVNTFGAFYFCRACVKHMMEKGWGRIINTTSSVGLNGHAMHVEYAASKGAVLSMSKSMAKEVGKYGITVNCVAPGIIPGPNTPDASGNGLGHTNFLNMTPSGEDIMGAILYLASDEARFVTGMNLVVDGGRSLAMRGTEP